MSSYLSVVEGYQLCFAKLACRQITQKTINNHVFRITKLTFLGYISYYFGTEGLKTGHSLQS